MGYGKFLPRIQNLSKPEPRCSQLLAVSGYFDGFESSSQVKNHLEDCFSISSALQGQRPPGGQHHSELQHICI